MFFLFSKIVTNHNHRKEIKNLDQYPLVKSDLMVQSNRNIDEFIKKKKEIKLMK